LIFVRTRVGTGELVNELMACGFPAEALNGDLNQETREQVLNRFRRNQITVLVATDMAARGLDIDDISHVFNYDLPEDPELYVHRVGRTARAGKTGIAISLLTSKELWRLRRIEGFTKQEISRLQIPTIEDIEKRRKALLMKRILDCLESGKSREEKEIVAELVEMGHDPLQIAAAALNMARGEEKQRPLSPISPVQEEKKSSGTRNQIRGSKIKDDRHPAVRNTSKSSQEKGMVRLTLNAGKAQGIKPGDIVGTIATLANLPGNAIGAINILEKNTFVDISQQFVAQALAKSGKYRIRKTAVSLERA
jgi:ATP-dependent RNA helicase DeaD